MSRCPGDGTTLIETSPAVLGIRYPADRHPGRLYHCVLGYCPKCSKEYLFDCEARPYKRLRANEKVRIDGEYFEVIQARPRSPGGRVIRVK